MFSHLLTGPPRVLWSFCSVDIAGLHFEASLVQRSSWCGSHSGLLPIGSGLSEDPLRCSCPQVVCLVECAHFAVKPCMVLARLLLLCRLVARERRVAVGVVAAFFFLLEVFGWPPSCLPMARNLGCRVRRRWCRRRSQSLQQQYLLRLFSWMSILSINRCVVWSFFSMCLKCRGELVSPLRRRVSVCPSVGMLATPTGW